MNKRQFLSSSSGIFLGLSNSSLEASGTERTRERNAPNSWKCVLTLDSQRRLRAGSSKSLALAIKRGADLRISTGFRHNEHIDTAAKSAELIREVADFGVTYLLDGRWSAGIMNLRPPIDLPKGFGERPSMSFFMYNEDGQQAIARPYLDGRPPEGKPGPSPLDDHSKMPRYHQQDSWDKGTNAPSSNFIYDFETYRFWVSDGWREVLSHTPQGKVVSGSIQALSEAFARGCEVKVGIRDLCADLDPQSDQPLGHEVFVQTGSGYYYTDRKLFIASSHPIIRVKPSIPLRYQSKCWDFGWVMPRTDGFVARWAIDPYTLKFKQSDGWYAMRWFVR